MTALILISSFLAALLTLFSGFGLGTLLMPVVAIFFPVEVAIGITAVVHLANNLFKLALAGLSSAEPLYTHDLFGAPRAVSSIQA